MTARLPAQRPESGSETNRWPSASRVWERNQPLAAREPTSSGSRIGSATRTHSLHLVAGPAIEFPTTEIEPTSAALDSRSTQHTGRMRKQYHFWPGAEGLDAWDVDRLIELSSGLPIIDVALDSIDEIDSVYWFDDRQERPTVRHVVDHVRLIVQADLSYPIVLGYDGRVMDGMHRIARAMLEGRETIQAVRFIAHPEPDYVNCRPEELPYDDRP
jgi:hypothetical protein